MKGGYNANLVISDMIRAERYKKKARQKCIVDEKKQYEKCKDIEVCSNGEVKDDIQDKQ